MNTLQSIVETRQGSIKVAKFNKPHRKNAIDVQMYMRIAEIINEAANDANISVMVLTGTGDFYSSGNDLMGAFEAVSLGERTIPGILKDFVEAFITFPKILIAVVNGPAIGVAATTLALCDLVFASENSFFYTPFTKLSLVAEGCSTYTFPRLIGDRKAAEMLLYNHKMSANEALNCGFVNYIYKPEDIQSQVWDKITDISKLSQMSLTACKKLMRRSNRDEMLKANEAEIEELQKVWGSEEYLNTLLEFANKKSKI